VDPNGRARELHGVPAAQVIAENVIDRLGEEPLAGQVRTDDEYGERLRGPASDVLHLEVVGE